MERLETMTNEKLQEIYTDKKLRNAVAFAHECWTACPNSHFDYKKALCWPVSYIVTDEQIELAKKELERSKKETQEKYKNSLLFIGMGMTYETDKYIGNHRIRTEFLNKHGHRFFVEFGTALNPENTRCDYSIDKDGKDGDIYNYANLERHNNKNGICDYTPKAVLAMVNRIFDCNFSEIFIDNYDLECEGLMCESPK